MTSPACCRLDEASWSSHHKPAGSVPSSERRRSSSPPRDGGPCQVRAFPHPPRLKHAQELGKGKFMQMKRGGAKVGRR